MVERRTRRNGARLSHRQEHPQSVVLAIRFHPNRATSRDVEVGRATVISGVQQDFVTGQVLYVNGGPHR